VVPKDAGPEGAVDLTTNKRTVSTRVLIEDGGIVVLGGLTSADYSRQETRVPFLGAIPVLGQLFKTRSGSADRTDLMVFIRPKILRTDEQSAIETNTKYNYIREEQRKVTTGEKEWLPILPGVKQPELPPMAPASQSTTPAPTSAAEKEKAGEEEHRSRLVPQTPAGTPAPAAPAAPATPPADAPAKPFAPTPDPPSTDSGHP
jgi:general secretion pathway protein D